MKFGDLHPSPQKLTPHLISVVVCTDGRLESLKALHASLYRQTHSGFEIVYVVGPTNDGSWEAVSEWVETAGVKAARCPVLNLSRARNIGITLAAGELIAFVDDDALPEPEWLVNLAAVFDVEDVGGAGGAVLDPTGIDYQFRFSAVDRLGGSHHGFDAPPDEGAYPHSELFPHVMGANCMFRREALVEIGGFDEEFEYYLDETDVCCRLIDAGYQIRQVEDAPMHHKFLRNNLRNEAKILLKRYPILKNKVYFALLNSLDDAPLEETLARLRSFFEEHRQDLIDHHVNGRTPPTAIREFEADAERAWRDGLSRGLSGQRQLASPEHFASPPLFQSFSGSRRHAERSGVVYVGVEGEETEVMGEAQRLAAIGLDVHVILVAAARDDVSFVDGIWIRRRTSRYAPMSKDALHWDVPEPFWRLMAAVSNEIARMERLRPIDEVIDMTGLALVAGLVWEGRTGVRVSISDGPVELPSILLADANLTKSSGRLIAGLHAIVEAASGTTGERAAFANA
jgi:glycogen synthase